MNFSIIRNTKCFWFIKYLILIKVIKTNIKKIKNGIKNLKVLNITIKEFKSNLYIKSLKIFKCEELELIEITKNKLPASAK